MLESASVRGRATQYPPTGDQIIIKAESIPVAKPKEASAVANSTDMDDTGKKSLPDASQGPLYLNYDTLTASGRDSDDGTECEQSRGTGVQDGKEGDLGDEGREEESLEARIERLGRERPEQFKSFWAECVFVFSIAMSQVLSVSHAPKKIIDLEFNVCRNTSSRASPSSSRPLLLS